MPYIQDNQRAEVDPPITHLVAVLSHREIAEIVGILNYIITQLLVSLWKRLGPSYSVANALLGVLTCAAREFARRHLDPYEDQKIAENGDITPL